MPAPDVPTPSSELGQQGPDPSPPKKGKGQGHTCFLEPHSLDSVATLTAPACAINR